MKKWFLSGQNEGLLALWDLYKEVVCKLIKPNDRKNTYHRKIWSFQ